MPYSPKVWIRDLESIVQKEAFHWGDNATSGYFEPAAKDMDRQWAWVEAFLSQFPIDYRNTVDLACGHGRNSEKLALRAKNLILVDVNPQNISFCKRRFSHEKNWIFVRNNGFDLREIADNSITFIYCFEAAVHFDIEIILSYIKEFRRILSVGGFGFVHHSTFTGNPGGDMHTHPHGRNFMSKELFAHLCVRNGLEIIDQHIVDWRYEVPVIDCFSLFRNAIGGYAKPTPPTSTMPEGSNGGSGSG
jgi:ubiquinone/menaquinone biosynthesis C-methylase UbiE